MLNDCLLLKIKLSFRKDSKISIRIATNKQPMKEFDSFMGPVFGQSEGLLKEDKHVSA
jgi:hypothetical protein